MTEESKAEPTTSELAGKVGCQLGVLGLVIIVLVMIFSGGDDVPASYAVNDNVSSEADREKGLHCLTSYDGSNLDAKYKTEELLRDPDSFEHVSTRIFPNDNGEHGLVMTYRAANGFGGMNVETMYARVDHETCQARLLPGGPGSE